MSAHEHLGADLGTLEPLDMGLWGEGPAGGSLTSGHGATEFFASCDACGEITAGSCGYYGSDFEV